MPWTIPIGVTFRRQSPLARKRRPMGGGMVYRTRGGKKSNSTGIKEKVKATMHAAHVGYPLEGVEMGLTRCKVIGLVDAL